MPHVLYESHVEIFLWVRCLHTFFMEPNSKLYFLVVARKYDSFLFLFLLVLFFLLFKYLFVYLFSGAGY